MAGRLGEWSGETSGLDQTTDSLEVVFGDVLEHLRILREVVAENFAILDAVDELGVVLGADPSTDRESGRAIETDDPQETDVLGHLGVGGLGEFLQQAREPVGPVVDVRVAHDDLLIEKGAVRVESLALFDSRRDRLLGEEFHLALDADQVFNRRGEVKVDQLLGCLVRNDPATLGFVADDLVDLDEGDGEVLSFLAPIRGDVVCAGSIRALIGELGAQGVVGVVHVLEGDVCLVVILAVHLDDRLQVADPREGEEDDAAEDGDGDHESADDIGGAVEEGGDLSGEQGHGDSKVTGWVDCDKEI